MKVIISDAKAATERKIQKLKKITESTLPCPQNNSATNSIFGHLSSKSFPFIAYSRPLRLTKQLRGGLAILILYPDDISS